MFGHCVLGGAHIVRPHYLLDYSHYVVESTTWYYHLVADVADRVSRPCARDVIRYLL